MQENSPLTFETTFKSAETSRIDELAEQFERKIGTLIAGRAVAALADFPNHSNVGDSAIYLGEISALRRIGANIKRMIAFDHADRSAGIASIPADADCILVHGGGNFGDLYPIHQNLRLDLIRSHPQARIVQLPQSLSFSSKAAIRETANAISQHEDFHLLVRDANSAEFARHNFQCEVHLVPDAALSLRQLPRKSNGSTVRDFGLLRTDKEQVLTRDRLLDQDSLDKVEDWVHELPTRLHWLDERAKRALSIYPSLQAFEVAKSGRRWLYHALAQQRVNRGIAQLSQAQRVTTDRLHAFIFCCMLGIPCRTLDNSTGKISAFRETWSI